MCTSAEQEVGVGAGPDEEVLVGLLGRLRAAGVDHDEPPAARPERVEPAGEVGRGHQAAVRRVRVRAEDQEVVGAVEVGHRDDERARRTSGPRDTCFGIWSTVLAREDVRACRAPASSTRPWTRLARLCALGLPM